MKQPFNGLFSVQTLKDNYLSVGIAAVLLCFSLSLSAQTYDSTRKLQIVGGDGFIWKSGEFLGKMKAPVGLAPLSSKDSGSMSFSNGSMYFFNGATWNKIGTGSGGTTVVTGAPDSTYARFVNTTGRNYRIIAVGVTGGATVAGTAAAAPTQQVVTGGNVTINNSTALFIYNNSSTTASATLTLPVSPTDGQTVDIHFINAITTFALNTAAGQTISQSFVPTSISAGEHLAYTYVQSLLTWINK